MKTRKWSEKPDRKKKWIIFIVLKEKKEIKDEQTKTEFSLSLSFFAQSITKTSVAKG